jgi:hypothetical protein
MKGDEMDRVRLIRGRGAITVYDMKTRRKETWRKTET